MKIDIKAITCALFLLILPIQGLGQDFSWSSIDIISSDANKPPMPFRTEMALTPDQWMQGLMFRPHIDDDAAMLFDFGEKRPISMWMKNTFISLDMIFIDEDGTVIGFAKHAKPLSTDTITSPKPARAVLEVKAGTVDRLGLKSGDRLGHPLFNPPPR